MTSAGMGISCGNAQDMRVAFLIFVSTFTDGGDGWEDWTSIKEIHKRKWTIRNAKHPGIGLVSHGDFAFVQHYMSAIQGRDPRRIWYMYVN